MCNRFYLILLILLFLVPNSVKAAACLDVFPNAINDSLLGSGNEFINIPPFTGADWYMDPIQAIPLGDSQHLSWYSEQTVIVNSTPVSETSARLYIAGGANWVNAKLNVGGNPEDLIIIASGSLSISGGQTEINAIIYSLASVTVSGNVTINGAIAAEGNISTNPAVNINYDQNAIENADFNGMCDNATSKATLVSDWRMDEDSWQGAADELIDSSDNNFHGTTVSASTSSGFLCNAADLSATGTNDYLSLDYNAINGLKDFTLSAWVKTSRTSSQAIVSVANSSQSNEAVLYYENRTSFWPTLRENPFNTSTKTPISDISTDSWKHHVWTRKTNTDNGELCLHIDNVLQGCTTHNNGEFAIDVDANGFILGQEQDSVGGGFDSSQAFSGLLDEVLLFEGILSTTEIIDINNNQVQGKNWDGTPRSCGPAAPVADWRMDEIVWQGSADEIIDNSGNDYHGRAISTSVTEGFICNAADLSATGTNDYLSLDHNAINGLDDFTLSAWVKTTRTAGQTLLSVANSSQSNEAVFYYENNTSFWPTLRESPFNTSTKIPASNISTGSWKHHVWTRKAYANDGELCLYIDNVLQGCSTHSNGEFSIEVDATGFILGQEQDSVGGGFDGSQAFSGLLDEVLLFDTVLSTSDINNIYTNQSQGKNWDGTDRSCGLIAEWRMEEPFWNGSTGEVLSEHGALHGTANGSADTDRQNPARSGNPGTCGYGTFNGSNGYVEVADNDKLDFTKKLTVTAWIYPENLPTGGGLKTILSKDTNYEFHVNSSGEIFWWWSASSFATTGANIEIGKWNHIAITYESGQQFIYVNGAQKGVHNYVGELIGNSLPLQIGADQLYGGRFFLGDIDEVRIYDDALSASEVNAVYLETHPCDSFIDHFEVDALNGQGLTCEQDTITLRACSDVSCNTLNHDNQVVTLIVSEGNTPRVTKQVTIVGGEVDVDYRYTKQGIATLSLDQTYECINGSPTDCDVNFADAAFRFVSGDASNTDLPVQLSGKPSNIGYNEATLKIEAIKADPLDPSACIPLLLGDPASEVVIDMAASYQDPGNGSKSVNISGDDIGTAVNGTTFDSLPFTDITLDFRDLPQHSADYIFTYPDAGTVQLHARYELPDDEGNPSGNYIKGSSNPLIVRPFAFDMFVDKNLATSDPDYKDNPGATSASGDIFTVAADDIRIRTRAVVWKPGNDDNNNGIADQGENLSGNTTTENFTSVNLTELSHNQLQPTSSEDGVLTVEANAEFSAGIQVDTANYDEVGIISLSAIKLDYLAEGITIEGSVPFVGRFTPDHFTITNVNNGILTGTCSSTETGVLPFIYIGQMLLDDLTTGAISYSVEPSVVIQARNKKDVRTKNYIDDFFKLSLTDYMRLTPESDAVAPGKLGDLVRLTANLNTATLADTNGEITYTYASNDNFVYLHEENSEITQFESDINLVMVSIIDDDDIETLDFDENDLEGPILIMHPQALYIRFGRAQLENSYGPETSNLPQVLSVNYFDEGQYIVVKDDECTPYKSTNISLTNIDLINFNASTPLPGITTAEGHFKDETPPGITRAIELTAPGADNTGQVEVFYSINDWLQYDWDYDEEGVDGLFNDNPRGIATFGIFRGNDRIIYQREIAK